MLLTQLYKLCDMLIKLYVLYLLVCATGNVIGNPSYSGYSSPSLNFQLTGSPVSDDDPVVDMTWAYVDTINFFIGPSVNFVMQTLPFMRFIPSVYKTRFDRLHAAKNILAQRFFYSQKVILFQNCT